MIEARDMESAPQDGEEFWAYSKWHQGIMLVRWFDKSENCELDGGNNPDDYISCFGLVDGSDSDITPSWWFPYDEIKNPNKL